MRPPASNRLRRAQQGYAFITVLFMAAALAISLAVALPRIAMQAQRVREERLIYRGKQYKRAIQLYFRANKKYPAKMEDLEDTNGVRYLRRRYKDPMNPLEDEWRIIHMGPDGRFKDSLIHDLEEEEEQQNAGRTGGIQPMAGIGSLSPQGRQAGYQAAYPAYTPNDGRFRGGERARAVRESAAPEFPGRGQGPPPDPNAPPAVDQYGNPIPPGQQAQAGEAAQQGQNQYPGYSRTLPSQIPPNAQSGQPWPPQRQGGRRQARAGQPNYGGFGAPGGIPGMGVRGRRSPQQPRQGQGSSSAFGGAPSAFGSRGGGQAADIIKGLLTTPRPGGLAGIQGRQNRGRQGTSFTGGIAGVASKTEDHGVKRYEGREYFSEWEFVYDYRTDEAFGGAALGPQSAAAALTQRLPAGQPGTSAAGALGATPGAVGFGGVPGAGVGSRGRVAQPGSRTRRGSTPSPYENLRTGPGGYNTNPRRPGRTTNLPPGARGTFPPTTTQPIPGQSRTVRGPNGNLIQAPPGFPNNQPGRNPSRNQYPFPTQPQRSQNRR